MEYINNSLCATRGELILSIMTDNVLDNLVRRKQVKIVVRGCRGRQAQYAVDSLPKKYREECYKRYDLPPMPREKSLLEELISPYPEAVRFYHAYRMVDACPKSASLSTQLRLRSLRLSVPIGWSTRASGVRHPVDQWARVSSMAG